MILHLCCFILNSMKKNIVLFALILAVLLAGCSQNSGTRTTRTIEVEGKPIEVEGSEFVLRVNGSKPVSVSEVIITQPENSNIHIEASVDNRLVEKDGVKLLLTTVTIEEVGGMLGIPLYVWILLGIIVLLVIITISACAGGKKEVAPAPEPEPEPIAEPVAEPQPEPEPAPEPEPEPESEVEIESAAYVETFIEEGKNKRKKPAPRFYGIDSLHDLVVLTKNTANRADDIQERCDELTSEIKQLNAEIRQNSGDTYADEIRRERLRTVKSNKNARLVYLKEEGRQVEVSNDNYAYLLKRLTGEVSEFRKTERFGEKAVNISQYDVVWLKKHLNIQ